jgi:hypothetical protein
MTSDPGNHIFSNKGGRLTPGQREYAIREIQNGRTQASVAAELGVTKAAISLLWVKWNNRETLGVPKVLTEEEQERLKAEMLRSSPKDHGLSGLGEERAKIWTGERAYALAKQLFDRKLNKLPITGLVHIWRRELSPRNPDAIPEAPTLEIDEDDLDPELRNDPDFMAYIRSPIARQIREREIACWQREQEERERRTKANMSSVPTPEDGNFNDISALPSESLVRTGKHKGSKGSPFTQSKKKKRKR